MAIFDWYQATIPLFSHSETVMKLANELKKEFDLSEIRDAKAQMGFQNSVQIHRGSNVLTQIYWGGNEGIHFRATSENSPVLATFLRSIRNDPDFGSLFFHKVTRMDSAIDIDSPGEFDRITNALLDYANNRKPKPLKISMAGDWHNGKGRTLYIGSRQSQVFLRVYEKGFETAHKLGTEVSRPDWVRIEAEIKPQKEFKAPASVLTPDECFGLSWLPEAMEKIGIQVSQGANISSPRISDFDKQKYYFFKQWSSFMSEWVKQTGCYDPMFEEIKTEIEKRLTS